MKYIKTYESFYEDEYNKFINKLSEYKSILITNEKIEFAFIDLEKESGGKCYYKYFTECLNFYLFRNYITSYYSINGDYVKEKGLEFKYEKKKFRDPPKLGTGWLSIKQHHIYGGYTYDVIDKNKPLTFYIEETIVGEEAKKYNL